MLEMPVKQQKSPPGLSIQCLTYRCDTFPIRILECLIKIKTLSQSDFYKIVRQSIPLAIQGAAHTHAAPVENVRIDLCRLHTLMTEQLLDGADVIAILR